MDKICDEIDRLKDREDFSNLDDFISQTAGLGGGGGGGGGSGVSGDAVLLKPDDGMFYIFENVDFLTDLD